MYEYFNKIWGYRTLDPDDGWFISLVNDDRDKWARVTLDVPDTPGLHFSASDTDMVQMMLDNIDEMIEDFSETKAGFEQDRQQIMDLTPSDFK